MGDRGDLGQGRGTQAIIFVERNGEPQVVGVVSPRGGQSFADAARGMSIPRGARALPFDGFTETEGRGRTKVTRSRRLNMENAQEMLDDMSRGQIRRNAIPASPRSLSGLDATNRSVSRRGNAERRGAQAAARQAELVRQRGVRARVLRAARGLSPRARARRLAAEGLPNRPLTIADINLRGRGRGRNAG